MTLPLFSIITVTYNAETTLEDTILSVIRQDSSLFEYIIIDGKSTDDTLKYIKKYEKSISYWASSEDTGIYDAMNKGIKVSRGKWILFLGADDRLKEGILTRIKPYLLKEADLVFGNVVFNDGRRYNSSFNLKTLLHNTIHHQGAFYNRRLFSNFKYDTSFKIMSDYELNLIIYLNKGTKIKVDLDVAECDVNGASFALALSLRETNLIKSKHFNKGIAFALNTLLKIKYLIQYEVINKIKR